MGKKVYLTFETSLTDICEINSSFDKGVLRVCYTGENRNRSYIAKEDLERCAKSLLYVPVVGNYIRSEEDFGGHDVEVITTLDGELRMVNKTQPVGVVPANAQVYFDTIIDDNGNEKEYLFTEVLLWKRQEAYKKIKEDGIISHSMEITVKDGETIDGIYHIYDFEFTALCLLGSGVEPCFEDSALEVYTTSDFKAQFELMMDDFKESFNLATTSTEDNYSRNDTLTKGGEEDLEVIKDVFAEEEVIEEKEIVDEPVEEAPAEEPEAEEVFEDEPEAEEAPAEESEEEEAEDEEAEDEEDSEEEFALVRELENALFEQLWNTDRISDGESDWPRYFMVDFDAEAGVVYFEDAADEWKLFGCNFVKDGDNVVIDFDSKKRMKYTIVEFDEGSMEGRFEKAFERIRSDATRRIEEANEAAAQFEAQVDALTTEINEMKDEANKAAEIDAHNEVIEEFADLVGVEEFAILCENMLDFDVDTFREKCYAIRGKNMSNPTSAKFSNNAGMPKFPVESNGVKSDEASDAPYGGVVEKYSKRA